MAGAKDGGTRLVRELLQLFRQEVIRVDFRE